MTNDIKQPLIAKIAELKAEIANSNIDWETAKAVYDAQPSLDDAMASFEYFMANSDALVVYQNHKEIADYEETLTMDLAQVTTRYIITDGNLISPAGFHPSSGVYVKNDVWIETDTLPQSLRDLKAFDVQKDKEAA
jgi:hypothetical protein